MVGGLNAYIGMESILTLVVVVAKHMLFFMLLARLPIVQLMNDLLVVLVGEKERGD